jgi:signal transduction histidine kinase
LVLENMHAYPPATGRALILSFAAVALVFTVGIAAAQIFSLRIRAAAHDLTENSAPTLSYLSSMRGTLREMEVVVEDHVSSCDGRACGPPPRRVGDLRRGLRDTWENYRLLPTYPGEADQWPRIEEALTSLGDAVALTFAALEQQRGQEAQDRLRDDVKPAFDRLDAEVARLIDWDHEQALDVATRIDGLARVSIALSVLLDLVSVGLTILAAALGIRVVRRYEQSLRDRADDLDQFAGRVAHDIKGPLATTAAALHIARREASEPGRTALERGRRGLERVQRLVEGLLEFARAGAMHSQGAAAEVQAVVDDVIGELRPVAEAHRVELGIEAISRQAVACSPGVLTSVVENVVRNAITHMGASALREVRIRAPHAEPGRAVRIEVEDTGPGIPEDLGERVFEPFVRGPETDEPGSGLGLATVRRFVTAHGGRMGFRSRPGQGTLFWLELPQPLDRPAGRRDLP